MPKKSKKSPAPGKSRARTPRASAPPPRELAPAPTAPIPSAPEPPASALATVPARRRIASPAQRRGADLTRYLKIHLRKPYGTRGEEAIRRLAVEVAHLGNLELNATESVVEPTSR